MPKIIFITSRFPYPLNKGDKLRVYFQLKHLAEEIDIHLIAIDHKNISQSDMDAISPFCKSIHLFVLPLHKRVFQLLISPFKRLPLQVAFFYNSGIERKIKQLTNEIKPDHIHCHLIRTTEYVKNIKHPYKSLDFMDAFGMGMKKRQNIEHNILKKALYQYEKRQLFSYEEKVFSFINKFCIISNQDKNSIQSLRANEINVIPNGVDFAAFHPRNEEKKYDLLFMGNLDYPPNIAAVLFLAHEIIPLVKKQKPDIKLLIAGMNAPKRVKKLQSENIEIIENFTNISDSIAISKIMIAPMQISIGLQNKILQAMAMKTPCIVSTQSNNAVSAPNNKAIIEANTPLEFTNEIMELINNEVKASELGDEGYKFVMENYSWEKQNDLLSQLIFKTN